ncbi:hypothetical protein, partial [Burkholderia sp. LMG 13014]|uniref:hypothetical protein n=1 Tax=Burkholderia sp. LMG 13014 TaxID=2709306 RepID=UPI001965DC53
QWQRKANHQRSHRISGVPPLSLSNLPGNSALAAYPRHCTIQLLSTPASWQASGNFFRHSGGTSRNQ